MDLDPVEVAIVLDTGAVLRVVHHHALIYDQGKPVGSYQAAPRQWYLDGEQIPEWAGKALVEMMVATGRMS